MIRPRPESQAVADRPVEDRSRGPRGPVGAAEVVALESCAATSRALDHRYGGGRCVDEVVGRLPAALALLDLPVAAPIGGPLRTAVADLHNVAVCHLLDGQGDSGTRLGEHAVDLCQTPASPRTTERLRPLEDAARAQSAHRDARALAVRIHRYRVAGTAPGWPSTNVPDW